MAILSTLPGVEVTVCVGRVPLKEYDDDEVNQTLGEDALRLGPVTVSKYIEAITDREFTVDLCVQRPYLKTSPTLTFDVYVDGHWATGKVMEIPAVTSHIPIQRTVDGALSYNALTGEGKVHHFKFSGIRTSKLRLPDKCPYSYLSNHSKLRVRRRLPTSRRTLNACRRLV